MKSYSREVFYYETDQMAIVHHSNYARWLEEARVDMLSQVGLPYDKMEQEGILVPVLGLNVQYRLAFRYGDRFDVKVKIDKYNGIKLQLSYEIYDDKGQLHATAQTEHCFVTSDMKPLSLKRSYPDINAKMEEAMGQLEA